MNGAPAYERPLHGGIVHLGIGAFHRAHQAVYTDDAMNGGDRNWGITGISLRAPQVRDQLRSGRPWRRRRIHTPSLQKIPQRWPETLRVAQSQGRRCEALLRAVAAQLWNQYGMNGIAGALSGPGGRFPQWTATPDDLAALTAHVFEFHSLGFVHHGAHKKE